MEEHKTLVMTIAAPLAVLSAAYALQSMNLAGMVTSSMNYIRTSALKIQSLWSEAAATEVATASNNKKAITELTSLAATEAGVALFSV